MQARCMVCVERTIGLEIVFDTPMELLGDVVLWNLTSFSLEAVLLSVQDRCMVCAKHTNCLEIILDTPDGTPR
jgi:hypothetical protein